MSREGWRTLPLTYIIIEALERRGGQAKDLDLYKDVLERVDVKFTEFLKAIMVLEMQGIVRVSVIKENLRNIELVKRV